MMQMSVNSHQGVQGQRLVQNIPRSSFIPRLLILEIGEIFTSKRFGSLANFMRRNTLKGF